MEIALIGYGVENASAHRFLVQKYPEATFTVYDEADTPGDVLPDGVGFVGGLHEFKNIDADLLVRTPGIAPYKIETKKRVTTATKLFFDECTLPIIGVTGSKGKGTTASLIASILRAGGKTVWLVGNIGTPALDILSNVTEGEIVVYELSSFQLWDLEKSPQTAVILMIEPEHLDMHRTIDNYIAAKSNIARFQREGDRTIYYVSNDYSDQIARLSNGEVTGYPDEYNAHIDNGRFYYGDTEICSVEELQLPGDHNRDNAIAAIDAAWPWVSNPQSIAKGLRYFEGLPHRLKFVAERNDVRYYDDSIATTPGSAIAAIRSFNEPKILILGGSSKGVEFGELARVVKESDVVHVLLIGDEAPRIRAALDDVEFSQYTELGTQDMATIVHAAQERAPAGGIVILSPACASFGMFKNYADRGDQFIHAVNQL